MDLDGHVLEGAKDLAKMKKKRGGTRFSAPKALKQSAMRKRGGTSPNGDDREVDVFDIFNEEGPLEAFRRNVKICSHNLDVV